MESLELSGREEALVDLLAELSAQFGYQRLVCGPLIGAGDVVRTALAGSGAVEQILRRMLDCVGLADIEVKISDRRDLAAPPADGPTQPAIEFAELRGQVAMFDLDELGELEDIVGVLAHQVGRVFLATTKHPFRDSAEPGDQSEERASAAAVYLGFAAPATNVTHQVRSSSEYSIADGAMRTTTLVIKAGALPGDEMAFLVALRLTVSGAGARENKKAARQLNGQLGDFCRQALERLAPHEQALCERLGIADRAEWPSVESLALPPWRPRPPADDENSEIAARRRERNRDRPVFRVARNKAVGYGMRGAVAGAVAAGAIVALGLAPVIGLGVATALTLGGHQFGGRKRFGTCSEPSCKQRLADDASICPGCGGTVSGSIAHIDERLAAEEALDSE